jgi:hypothetical protein
MKSRQGKWKDFVEGMAGALDMGGTLVRRDTSCNHDPHSGWKADAAAIAEDWKAVGRDMRQAMDRFGEGDAREQNRKKTG